MPESAVAPPRITVVGYGRWGRNLERNFAELDVLGAVSNFDEPGATFLAEDHGVPAAPLEDILADPAIDAVAIVRPAATHDVPIAQCSPQR